MCAAPLGLFAQRGRRPRRSARSAKLRGVRSEGRERALIRTWSCSAACTEPHAGRPRRAKPASTTAFMWRSAGAAPVISRTRLRNGMMLLMTVLPPRRPPACRRGSRGTLRRIDSRGRAPRSGCAPRRPACAQFLRPRRPYGSASACSNTGGMSRFVMPMSRAGCEPISSACLRVASDFDGESDASFRSAGLFGSGAWAWAAPVSSKAAESRPTPAGQKMVRVIRLPSRSGRHAHGPPMKSLRGALRFRLDRKNCPTAAQRAP